MRLGFIFWKTEINRTCKMLCNLDLLTPTPTKLVLAVGPQRNDLWGAGHRNAALELKMPAVKMETAAQYGPGPRSAGRKNTVHPPTAVPMSIVFL